MAGEGKLVLKAKGLYTQQNNKSAVPDGALTEAKNVVIDKDDLIEPRRGFKLFGDTFANSTVQSKQLMTYDDRLIRHYETSSTQGSLESQDTPGGTSFTKLKELKMIEASSLTHDTVDTATFSGVSDHGLSTGDEVTIDGAAESEYNGTFTVTVTSTTDFTYTTVGVPATPDTGNAFLVEGTANDIIETEPGNKIKNEEVNGNLYFTTSEGVRRIDSFNSTVVKTGVPKALDFSVSLNSEPTGWFNDTNYVGYRIVWGISDNNNNLYLGAPSSVLTVNNTSGGAATTTLTTSIPANITTSHFYQVYRTSQASTTPPSQDYQLVYEANPTYEEIATGELSIDDIQLDIFRGATLYTNNTQEGESQANVQPPFAQDIALYNGIMFYANTKTRHKLAVDLVALDALTAGSSTLEFDNGTDSFTINIENTEDAANGDAELVTASTTAVNIEETARSIVRVINSFDSNTFVIATYISNPDQPPGKMLFEAVGLNEDAFTIQATNSITTTTVSSNEISAYNPELITAEPSINDEKPNRIYYSKLNEPEAVPALNFFRIGGGDNEIIRIAALRDSLFVFSTEGIFRIVGDTPQGLSVTAFDLTTTIKARESLANLDNQIYIFGDQGVTSVSDTGVSILSRQIEDQLLPLFDPDYTNFNSATFGLSYQSDRKYILWTVSEFEDTFATKAYVYNTITQAWTTWALTKTCGIVNSYDDKLYLGSSDVNSIEQERKNFNYKDHADREFSINITQVSNSVVSSGTGANPSILAYNHGLENGDRITFVDCDATPSLNDGSFIVTIIDNDNFTINATLTGAATTGRWRATNRNVPLKLQVASVADININDVVEQTLSSTVNSTTYDYILESEITDIDDSALTLTLNRNLFFEIGAATNFCGYEKTVTYVPVHANNPAMTKHFREAHVMFDDYRGSEINLTFSSDVSRSEVETTLNLNVFGEFGLFSFGDRPWGGDPFEDNMRTYLPRDKQRCRLLNVKYTSNIAREKWELEGIALYYRNISERTNRR
jgi:hypothetical protein